MLNVYPYTKFFAKYCDISFDERNALFCSMIVHLHRYETFSIPLGCFFSTLVWITYRDEYETRCEIRWRFAKKNYRQKAAALQIVF